MGCNASTTAHINNTSKAKETVKPTTSQVDDGDIFDPPEEGTATLEHVRNGGSTLPKKVEPSFGKAAGEEPSKNKEKSQGKRVENEGADTSCNIEVIGDEPGGPVATQGQLLPTPPPNTIATSRAIRKPTSTAKLEHATKATFLPTNVSESDSRFRSRSESINRVGLLRSRSVEENSHPEWYENDAENDSVFYKMDESEDELCMIENSYVWEIWPEDEVIFSRFRKGIKVEKTQYEEAKLFCDIFEKEELKVCKDRKKEIGMMLKKITHSYHYNRLFERRLFSLCRLLYDCSLFEVAQRVLMKGIECTSLRSLVVEYALLQGEIYLIRGKVNKAMDFFQKARTMSVQLNNTSLNSHSLRNISTVHSIRMETSKAMKSIEDALYLSRGNNDGKETAECLLLKGSYLRDANELDDSIACFKKCLTISKIEDDPRMEHQCLEEIFLVMFERGKKTEKTMAYLENVRGFYKKNSYKCEESVILYEIGEVYIKLGEYKKALEAFHESIQIKHAVGVLIGMPQLYYSIGDMFFGHSSKTTATKYFNECVKYTQMIGVLDVEAMLVDNLGDLFKSRGYMDNAKTFYIQALELYKKLGKKQEYADCSFKFGSCSIVEGKIEGRLCKTESSNMLKASLIVQREIGDKIGECKSLLTVSGLRTRQNRFMTAKRSAEVALQISVDIDDSELESLCLRQLGIAYNREGDLTQAFKYFKHALSLSEDSKDENGIAECLFLIAEFHRIHNNDIKNASELYRQSFQIAGQNGFHRLRVDILCSCGGVHLDRKEFSIADECYRAAFSISQQLGDICRQGQILRSLAKMKMEERRNKEAIELLSACFEKFLNLELSKEIVETSIVVESLLKILKNTEEEVKLKAENLNIELKTRIHALTPREGD